MYAADAVMNMIKTLVMKQVMLHRTPFEKLPEDWICPDCGEEKEHFIEIE